MNNRIKLEIILSVLLAGMIGLAYFVTTSKDRTHPVITFTEDPVYYEGDGNDVLLTGVQASDDIDGDVTASVVVDHIVESADGASITVYYAAKDNSNNVVKSSRVVVVHKAETPPVAPAPQLPEQNPDEE